MSSKNGWVLALAALLLVACLPGANDVLGVSNAAGDLAGFWRGVWHGVVFPLSFVVSLFTRDVQVYEVHNNGGWYNAGYLLGLSICFGGPCRGPGRAWRRK